MKEKGSAVYLRIVEVEGEKRRRMKVDRPSSPSLSNFDSCRSRLVCGLQTAMGANQQSAARAGQKPYWNFRSGTPV